MRLVYFRGKWCVYWRDESGPRRVSLGTSDKAEAERRYLDWQSDQRRSESLTTVGQIVEAYFKDREARKPGSARRHAWKGARETFGDLLPRHVTRDICRTYTERCRKAGRSDATIRDRLSTIAAALRWHDPATPAVIEMPPPPPPRDRRLSREEAVRLIEAARPTPHLHLFIVLALTTAARKTALLELTWDRVDLDRGRLDLGEGDGNKRRARPPINESARFALVAARQAATTDYVIEYAGRQVGDIKKGFARACERAGLQGVSPHTLRHTAAVWMAEAAVPMSEISQYMGHTTTAVTERVYARYSPDYLRRAASALEIDTGSLVQKRTTRRKAK
ncbi:tyrosine-type recombinase/integrase [Fodinicurvata fenggangensis]|uniref:tyrosine-type recombinase/integrase n=1 Tax=Fodinicurvata fenggangensis TaxID=1121830 RepID=UPI00068E1596|nr:site-specific integrase [Fodinicurvata fenggangensis]